MKDGEIRNSVKEMSTILKNQ